MKPTILAILSALLLFGAADPKQSAHPTLPPFSCPAPGMPSAADLKNVWKPVDMSQGMITADDGSKVPAVIVAYQNGAAVINIVFHENIPLSYDPSANDVAVDIYINSQYINDKGNYRTQPGAECSWRKVKAQTGRG